MFHSWLPERSSEAGSLFAHGTLIVISELGKQKGSVNVHSGWSGTDIVSLFNYLVGLLQQRRWNGEVERFARLEMDDQLRSYGHLALEVHLAPRPCFAAQGTEALPGSLAQSFALLKETSDNYRLICQRNNLALLLHGLERVTCRSQYWHGPARSRQIDRRPA